MRGRPLCRWSGPLSYILRAVLAPTPFTMAMSRQKQPSMSYPLVAELFSLVFLSPPFRRILRTKKRHRSIFCMGCLSDLQQNSRCYLVFLNFFQAETNVSLTEMWCLGLRSFPCPALLAFEPEQKVCAVFGLHKSTFMVILTPYIVVVNLIISIYSIFFQ